MRAYCWATGLIEFGQRTPSGAIEIARGPARSLREFIDATARHGYRTRRVRGRLTKVPGSNTLLVPGVPEAEHQSAGCDALVRYTQWIARHAKARGIVVNVGQVEVCG